MSIISKNNNKLSDNEARKVSAGQMYADDVMGVKGLRVCTGAPTENVPDGYFWQMNGVYVSREEAMDIIKSKATRKLNDDESFLESYIDNYNKEMTGEIIYDNGIHK